MAKSKSKKSEEPITDPSKAQEKGYFGVEVDPRPNSEYSLQSGPDSPPIAEGPDEPADYIKVRQGGKK